MPVWNTKHEIVGLHTLHVKRIDDRTLKGGGVVNSIVVTPTDFTVDGQRSGAETVAGVFGSVLQDEHARLSSHSKNKTDRVGARA